MGNWYVGIDGGGAKTAVGISAADCIPISTLTYPTCSYQSIGIQNTVALITRGVKEALTSVGGTVQDCGGCCVGMPCWGENTEKDLTILRMLKEALYPAPVYIVNDVEVGWAGSLECGEGIHIVSGTGSIVFGYGKDGQTARCGGWVEFFGDEGSCYWVGRETMGLFAKEADGRAPRAALYALIRTELGLTDDFRFVDRVMREIAPHRERVADFQRYALQAARAGDGEAEKLYEMAAEELALMVETLHRRLTFSAETVKVSYSGGIFHAGALILLPLRHRLESLGCALQAPCRTAVEGALMLAVKRFHAGGI